MEVRLFATLRPIVGGPSVQLDAGPGDSVRSLLDELIATWPDLKRELFDAEGQLHNNIHVFINGRDVRYLDGLDMAIPEGAQIRIFPPVGGGSIAAPPSAHGDGPQVHDYYGVPDWLMVEYLTDMGATETAPFELVADGWQAQIRKAVPKGIGSLKVGGSTVTFTGDAAVLTAMFEKLHWKTLRGGG
jgi:molybdopterin synthase sulfur carrier subunit